MTTSGPFSTTQLEFLRAKAAAHPDDEVQQDIARLIEMIFARDAVIRQLTEEHSKCPDSMELQKAEYEVLCQVRKDMGIK
jgi:hypothetical protein